jgi:ABC-type dipeptide/oligopeptide/nickel transport system permease component
VSRTLISRLLQTLPVLWVAVTLVWIFMFLIPGDPARTMAGLHARPETVEAIRQEWGLDRPPHVQYAIYMSKVARGNLGTSYLQERPVTEILWEGFIRTAILAAAAVVLALVSGIALGVTAARRGGVADALLTAGSVAGISIPSFLLGLLLMLVFAGWLRWLPVSGYGAGPEIFGLRFPSPAHLVLPSITLALYPAALIARVTRAAFLEQMGSHFVLAARARGLQASSVVWRHAFPNALTPVITISGLLTATLLGGAIATEIVFAWPGLGRVLYRAINTRDILVVEGGVIILTSIFILSNLLVDLAYNFIDPRIRHRRG